MKVNDLVEALGLPRYYAANLPPGSAIVATVKADGSITIEIRQPMEAEAELPVMEQKRGPGRPRKVI